MGPRVMHLASSLLTEIIVIAGALHCIALQRTVSTGRNQPYPDDDERPAILVECERHPARCPLAWAEIGGD